MGRRRALGQQCVDAVCLEGFDVDPRATPGAHARQSASKELLEAKGVIARRPGTRRSSCKELRGARERQSCGQMCWVARPGHPVRPVWSSSEVGLVTPSGCPVARPFLGCPVVQSRGFVRPIKPYGQAVRSSVKSQRASSRPRA